jgi:glycosyltransferase involved in cell wall biosynthesis
MNKRASLVSVVIANKNCQEWLGESIPSALNQTYRNIEVIIVDDNSTDDSCRIVRSYASADPRVKLIQSEKPLYISGARNLGIERASGEFIALLDADDRMLPEAIERQLTEFTKAKQRNPDTQMICFDAYIINEKGHRISRYMPAHLWGVVRDIDLPKRLGRMSAPEDDEVAGWSLPGTWFFPRNTTARFHPAWQSAESRPFLDQIRRSGGFCYVGDPVIEYRMRMQSVTNVDASFMMRAFLAAELTISAKRDWSDPILPLSIPAPSWSTVAAWKYGRIAKSAAVNGHLLTALFALAIATIASPRSTVNKILAEVRRLYSIYGPQMK